MSFVHYVVEECSVCGQRSQQYLPLTLKTCERPDLDLRPSEPQRSLMMFWVQECPRCGYAAQRIRESTSVKRAFLSSKPYLSCCGIRFDSPIAALFYRHYLIKAEDGDCNSAFRASLCAAWACDDVLGWTGADVCRENALEQLEKMMGSFPYNHAHHLQKIDLLRRLGRFKTVLKEYRGFRFGEECYDRLLSFQLKKAAEQDAARYTFGDALYESDREEPRYFLKKRGNIIRKIFLLENDLDEE